MNFEKLMAQALVLARKGEGHVSPNPMVGCVILKGSKVVSTGWHKKYGGPHAEVYALKAAGAKAKGATLVINLEPCFHHGKTPPCVDAVIQAGIKHVVMAMKDPNPKVAGKSVAKLRRAGIKVTTGVLKVEAEFLNRAFVKHITTGLPFVTAKCAQSLDGKIACRTGASKWITSEDTRTFSRSERQKFDAIVIGANTMRQDDPCLHQTKGLKKVIVDSTLRLKETAKLFKVTQPENIILATTKQAAQAKIKRFEQKGVQVLVAPAKNKRVNLTWLFKTLGAHNIAQILIEGGGTLIGSALREKLVDEMNIFVAPKILGDQQAVGSISGLMPKVVDQSVNLDIMNVVRLKKDILIHAKVIQ